MGRAIPDWPRMMRRTTAAAYCDLTAAEFEREVASGALPQPIKLGSQEHWSRTALDQHLERLCGEGAPDWQKACKLFGEAA